MTKGTTVWNIHADIQGDGIRRTHTTELFVVNRIIEDYLGDEYSCVGERFNMELYKGPKGRVLVSKGLIK